MADLSMDELLAKAVSDALRAEVEKEVGKIIAEAKESIEREIRKHAAKAVMMVHSYYSVERIGNVLRIEVKLPEKP
jgi:hypothetical protein